MIDIHSHLLPGIDDGPRTWEESLALCRRVVEQGVTTSIATPHLIDGVYNNTRSRLVALVGELSSRLSEAGIPLEVLPGAEVDISSRHVLEVTDELPRIGNGQAVLIEMPVAVVPPRIAETLFRVRASGLIPILAHPERNEELQRRPGLARDWFDTGAALQLDAESLLGLWGRDARACAEAVLRAGLYSAVASDAHSVDRRPPRLREALERVSALVDGEALRLVNDGPRALLAGDRIDLGLLDRRQRGRERTEHRTHAASERSFLRRLAGRWRRA
jgi:protein-tyrosine phosphatase